jgi:hypothetical protein
MLPGDARGRGSLDTDDEIATPLELVPVSAFQRNQRAEINLVRFSDYVRNRR